MDYKNIDINELDALKEYMSSHVYGVSADYDMNALYKMFCSATVFSIQDLFLSPRKFNAFVRENINLIRREDGFTTNERLIRLLEGKVKILENKLKTFCGLTQQQFAEIITDLVGKENKILDVGAGDFPYSSILLGENFQNVSSMDSKFELSPETLARLNVSTKEEYFSTNTDLSGYDVIVGQRPCSAIAHMVTECAKQNKPYFIELCNCHIPPSKTPGKPATWHEILPEIDAYVRFYGGYAFNIDATEEQVKKVMEEHEFFRIREKYFNEKLSLYNINATETEVKAVRYFSIDPVVSKAPDDTNFQPGL